MTINKESEDYVAGWDDGYIEAVRQRESIVWRPSKYFVEKEAKKKIETERKEKAEKEYMEASEQWEKENGVNPRSSPVALRRFREDTGLDFNSSM